MPDYILISPGPKNPSYAGRSLDFIEEFYLKIPILGICLGMQCISEFFGGRTVKASVPVHGKYSEVYHTGKGLFYGIPSPFKVARYHSLVVKPTFFEKKSLIVDAWSLDGNIMSVSHVDFPVYGVQFHPESFLTNYGFILVDNFLKLGPIGRI